MKTNGFTLIEVLVAIAILGIALIAIVRNTSEVAGNTSYLQSKTVAYLVARNILAESKSGVQPLPNAGAQNSGTMNLLNQDWEWHLRTSLSTNPGIEAIEVDVNAAGNNRTLASLTGFVAVDKNARVLP